MNIIDTHCDALLKLQGDARATHSYFQQERRLNYLNSDELEMNMERRIKGRVELGKRVGNKGESGSMHWNRSMHFTKKC